MGITKEEFAVEIRQCRAMWRDAVNVAQSLLHIHKDRDIDLDRVVQEFAVTKVRRLQLQL